MYLLAAWCAEGGAGLCSLNASAGVPILTAWAASGSSASIYISQSIDRWQLVLGTLHV